MLEELCKRDDEWRKIALKICGDKNIADDVVQQMYIRIYEQGKQWDEIKDTPEFYVYICCRNIFYNYLKHQKRYFLFDDLKKMYNVLDLKEEAEYEKKDAIEVFNRELNNVRYLHKEILMQNLVDRKSMRSIASEHNMTLSDVFNTCKTAKEIMKDKFYEHYKHIING